MSLGLSLDPLISNDVEASRISDADRDLKSLREKMLKFGRPRHNFDEAKLDERQLGRGLPRTMLGEVSDGFQELNASWEAKFARFNGVKLLKFDGVSHKVDFLDWIDTLEDYFQATNPPDDVKCKLATSKLRGEARIWWNEMQNTRCSEGENLITSWSTMSDLLHERFLNTSRLTWWYKQEHEVDDKPSNCLLKIPIESYSSKNGPIQANLCEHKVTDDEPVIEKLQLESLEEWDTPKLKCTTSKKFVSDESDVKHSMDDDIVPTKCSTEFCLESNINEHEGVVELQPLGASGLIYDDSSVGASKKSDSLWSIMEVPTGNNQLKGEFLVLKPLSLVNGCEEESETEDALYKDTDLGIVKLEAETPVSRLPKTIGHNLDAVMKVIKDMKEEMFGFMNSESLIVNFDPGGNRQCGLRMSGQIQGLLHVELLHPPGISVISKGGTRLKIEENSSAFDFDTKNLIERAASKHGLNKAIMEEYDWPYVAQRCKLAAVRAVHDEMDRFWVALHWLTAMIVVLFDPGGPYKDKLHWFWQHTRLLHNMSLNKDNMNVVKVNRAGPVTLKAFYGGPLPKLTAYEWQRIVLRFAYSVEKNNNEIAALEAWNNGGFIHSLHYYASWTEKTHGVTVQANIPYHVQTRHEPIDVSDALIVVSSIGSRACVTLCRHKDTDLNLGIKNHYFVVNACSNVSLFLPPTVDSKDANRGGVMLSNMVIQTCVSHLISLPYILNHKCRMQGIKMAVTKLKSFLFDPGGIHNSIRACSMLMVGILYGAKFLTPDCRWRNGTKENGLYGGNLQDVLTDALACLMTCETFSFMFDPGGITHRSKTWKHVSRILKRYYITNSFSLCFDLIFRNWFTSMPLRTSVTYTCDIPELVAFVFDPGGVVCPIDIWRNCLSLSIEYSSETDCYIAVPLFCLSRSEFQRRASSSSFPETLRYCNSMVDCFGNNVKTSDGSTCDQSSGWKFFVAWPSDCPCTFTFEEGTDGTQGLGKIEVSEPLCVFGQLGGTVHGIHICQLCEKIVLIVKPTPNHKLQQDSREMENGDVIAVDRNIDVYVPLGKQSTTLAFYLKSNLDRLVVIIDGEFEMYVMSLSLFDLNLCPLKVLTLNFDHGGSLWHPNGNHATLGRVIPWEGWDDRNDENNTNTQDVFIRDKIGVVIQSVWLSILSKVGHLRKTLRLFFKTVNGLDPPTHMKVKMDGFSMVSFNVARGRAFRNRGME